MKVYIIAFLMLLISVIFGIFAGSVKISLGDIAAALFNGTTALGTNGVIIRFVRIPRVLAALICGAALSVSGAVIQGVLANKLASPSIIGVNAGAGLAVTLCAALGLAGGFRFSLFAFTGAFITVLIVSMLAKRFEASRSSVILIGVAMNSLLGAFTDSVRTFVPEVSIMSNDFRIGDFSSVTYVKLIPSAVIIILSLLILMTLSNDLDVLCLGDDTAKGLGLNVGAIKVLFLILAAALSGAAVSIAGLLSFVGLLVPHAVRRFSPGESRHLLPLSALFGGSFVTLCDTLARTAFSPYELPVGIIMAFLGAPFFVFILIKKKGGHNNA
ncbi:MAG: iron ABC transporter permease [Eubacteriales bacterium]|nr:iron ABC transporter permease [Eubacteriales bacterium]